MAYNPKAIEPKWQAYWEENQTFRAKIDAAKPKYYALDMFSYPSGAGLHVGHPEGYTATDILCRYKRMRGFNVLHPMGWDSFGLPAERYAMRTGIHPAVTTKHNIEHFRRQVRRLGFSYDWSREPTTTDPEYVRWPRDDGRAQHAGHADAGWPASVMPAAAVPAAAVPAAAPSAAEADRA